MAPGAAGQEGAIAAPAKAAQSTKATSDLLRRFKEYATSVKEGMKAEPAPLTDEETALRNEKIRVDDFQDKLIHASRKVRTLARSCAFLNHTSNTIRMPTGRTANALTTRSSSMPRARCARAALSHISAAITPAVLQEGAYRQRADAQPQKAHPRLVQKAHVPSVVRFLESHQQHYKGAHRQEGKRSIVQESRQAHVGLRRASWG